MEGEEQDDGGQAGGGQAGGGQGDQAATAEEMMKPAEIGSFADFGRFLIDKGLSYWEGFLKISPLLIVALVILIFTWVLAKLVSTLTEVIVRRIGARDAIIDLTGVIAKTVVWIVGAFAALSVVFPSIDPGSLITGAGLGAAVIGIAFKDVFENFLAGFLLLARKSMRIGDYIDCESIEGKIERTTLRDTYLRRADGELVLVPNSYLFKNPVRVWTDPDYRRHDLAVGVGYGEDVAESREVIERAVRSIDLGADREAQVFAAGFGASSIDFNVRFWAEPDPLSGHQARDRVVEAIKSALDEAGIEIPFPYRTLTFSEPLPLRREEADTRGGERDDRRDDGSSEASEARDGDEGAARQDR